MPTLMPPSAGARLGAVALTVLTAAGASWFAPTAAVAAPGDGADIRIHEERVPYGVSKDDPAVCRFYLDAANFGDVTSVSYSITAQPPLPTAATVSGTISLAGGAGHTDTLGLADGRYTLVWTFIPLTPPNALPVRSKEKIFTVDCHSKHDPERGQQGPNRTIEDHGGPGGHQDGGPKGGVHAGGGGLVDTVQSYNPLSAAAGVGLVAVGGAVYVRVLRRRRSHGAA
ncbi:MULTISPECIES: hypothetical protein [unclassified Streptomyces]|uniref:hypothetical protein n=1 Tax=unclassified Streptomyces TaxID=2593676 RepID=UPI00224E4B6C|nr:MULTISPECIES: hypothetical protein [unclassified Streptomyces]MCX5047062.1 hypothetical protein [Streptomyces sp. NBC_00474]MCX5058239.1 hypothetical protein [Streptomyces sp. NBC_00452]MCX5244881.1 hypothetical protein [Streptomyces sp. NBC_00201]MCX5289387.1 hypothetical protein [Streptomyces sp. NBC_00183]